MGRGRDEIKCMTDHYIKDKTTLCYELNDVAFHSLYILIIWVYPVYITDDMGTGCDNHCNANTTQWHRTGKYAYKTTTLTFCSHYHTHSLTHSRVNHVSIGLAMELVHTTILRLVFLHLGLFNLISSVDCTCPLHTPIVLMW